MGQDDPHDDNHLFEVQQFRETLSSSLEKVTQLYVKNERKLCRFFCSLEAKTDLLHQRIAEQACELCSDGAGSHEERRARLRDSTAALLLDPANQQVFRALTGYLVHIDALRKFALLNTLALLRIANHHCSKALRDDILERLYQEPFFNCYRLTSLVDEIDVMQAELLNRCLSGPPDRGFVAARLGEDDGEGDASMAAAGDARRRPIAQRSFSDSEISRDRYAQTDAGDLAAYCTWVNQKGRLPAWICKSCDGARLSSLSGDLRGISVAPLVAGFARQLKRALADLGLSHVLPQLIQGQRQQPQHAQQPQPHARAFNADVNMKGARGTPCGPMAHRPDSPAAYGHPHRGAAMQAPAPHPARHPDKLEQHLLQHLHHRRHRLPAHNPYVGTFPRAPAADEGGCMRDSLGRRHHSPDGAVPHKRQCLDKAASALAQEGVPAGARVAPRAPGHVQQRDSPLRRRHSPDPEESHKRRCHELGTAQRLAGGPDVAARDLRRCDHSLGTHSKMEGSEVTAGTRTAGTRAAGEVTLRPSRSCYDLRSLDLQHQERRRAKPVIHCGVQQAALDLSYLSLAMGSPSSSSSPDQPPRRTSRDSLASDIGQMVEEASSPGMRPPAGAGVEGAGVESQGHMTPMDTRAWCTIDAHTAASSLASSSVSSGSGSSWSSCGSSGGATPSLMTRGEFGI